MTISPAYPDLLQNGLPADATQVMANFYQIQNDVNANAAHNGANSDITSLTGLTTPLGIAFGGTGGASAAAARTALGAAASGANSDITSLTGLVTPLSIAQGGTSAGTASAARTALGLGSAAVENLTAIIIDNGTGGLTIGAAQVTGAMIASSVALAGNPTTTTQALGDNSTKVATTAFVIANAGAKAWVNFNGSSGAIRASSNVSSITKNSTGDYTVNFTTAMADANYAIVSSVAANYTAGIGDASQGGTNPTTTACRVRVTDPVSDALTDLDYVSFAFFD